MNTKRSVIAVNARFLLDGKVEGIGRFSDEVLSRMVRLMPDCDFHFFFDRPWHSRFLYGPNVIPHVVHPQARHPFLYIAWFDFMIPRKLRKVQADLFFSPDGYLALSSKIPQIQVIHDLSFLHFPKDTDRLHAWHYNRWFPKFAKIASKILTVSEYTRKDIQQHYHIPAEKIKTVYNGCADVFHPGTLSEQEATRIQYTGGAKYFLYAGAIQPRKNLENLLRAYSRFREQHPEVVKLVLTGRKAWNFETVIQTYRNMPFREDVIFTGYVNDGELNRLYQGSIALCYVSRFEGFGLPLLEAMHAETALITCNTSSLPEVAGDAALYVHPDHPEEMADAMQILLTDEIKRDALIAAGRIQRNRFSWDKTAAACVEAIRLELSNVK
jgi:glycosyltransferase involved in cell wall biosynthesis